MTTIFPLRTIDSDAFIVDGIFARLAQRRSFRE
jgi:hypothetical protein